MRGVERCLRFVSLRRRLASRLWSAYTAGFSHREHATAVWEPYGSTFSETLAEAIDGAPSGGQTWCDSHSIPTKKLFLLRDSAILS